MVMDCKIKIKTKNMTQLAEYRSYLLKNPKLKYLFIELTDHCNLGCLHCGSNCNQLKKHYIDTKLIINTLNQIAEDFAPRDIMICLTGGEPLLHPDFYLIVEEINKLSFKCGITTNGTLIDEETAYKLKINKLESITISLDGLEEEHEWLRNNKGCFKKTIAAIHRLNSIDIPVQVTTVIHKRNIHELDLMYELMCSLKICSWRVINIEPIGRALLNNELLLSHSEFTYLLDYIRNKRYSVNTPMDVCFGCSHYLSYEYEHEVRDNYFICGAGIYVGSILYNGDIYSCLDIKRRKELVQGNIKKDRFSDVWKNRFKEFRADRTNLCEKCQKCNEKDFCNADSMHTWDFDNNKPMFCFLRKVE